MLRERRRRARRPLPGRTAHAARRRTVIGGRQPTRPHSRSTTSSSPSAKPAACSTSTPGSTAPTSTPTRATASSSPRSRVRRPTRCPAAARSSHPSLDARSCSCRSARTRCPTGRSWCRRRQRRRDRTGRPLRDRARRSSATASCSATSSPACACAIERASGQRHAAASAGPRLLPHPALQAALGPRRARRPAARRLNRGSPNADAPADPRLRDRRGRRTRVRPRLHGAHRRDRRRQVDPGRCAAAGRRRPRGQRRGAARRRASRGQCDVRRWPATPRRWPGSRSSRSSTRAKCQLRRVVGADGRGRAYLNGQTVPVQSLRALGELLVDVHGQLEFQSLSRRGYQRETAGRQRPARLARPQRCARAHAALAARSTSSARPSSGVARDRDIAARPAAPLRRRTARRSIPGRARPRRWSRSARGSPASAGWPKAPRRSRHCSPATTAASASALARVAARPAAAGRRSMRRSSRCRRSCRGGDDRLRARRWRACAVTPTALDADPARQEWVEARLAALEAVARKHRVETARAARPCATRSLPNSPSSMPAWSAQSDSQQRLAAARERYLAAAQLPHRGDGGRRRRALDRKVTASCRSSACRAACSPRASRPRIRRSSRAHGTDEIEFLVSANPGQPPRPLARVASGGELSRISLALQVATRRARRTCPAWCSTKSTPASAAPWPRWSAGSCARSPASGQVLCVTHLPQVASQADQQVRVSKTRTAAARRAPRIEPLDGDAAASKSWPACSAARRITSAHARARARDAGSRRRAPPRRRPPGAGAYGRFAGGAGSSRARSGRAG